MKSPHEKIYALEMQLLSASVRHCFHSLDRMLADDFTEFGQSGRVYTKADVLNALVDEGPRSFSVSAFRVCDLAENVYLATYTTVEQGQRARRSSIWKKSDTTFQIVFHQGTPIAKT